MEWISDLLGWQFSLGYAVGVLFGIAVMFHLTKEAAAECRKRLGHGQQQRSVEIIRRIVAKEMSGPSVKDRSARLAADVFIAGIEADARIRA